MSPGALQPVIYPVGLQAAAMPRNLQGQPLWGGLSQPHSYAGTCKQRTCQSPVALPLLGDADCVKQDSSSRASWGPQIHLHGPGGERQTEGKTPAKRELTLFFPGQLGHTRLLGTGEEGGDFRVERLKCILSRWVGWKKRKNGPGV